MLLLLHCSAYNDAAKKNLKKKLQWFNWQNVTGDLSTDDSPLKAIIYLHTQYKPPAFSQINIKMSDPAKALKFFENNASEIVVYWLTSSSLTWKDKNFNLDWKKIPKGTNQILIYTRVLKAVIVAKYATRQYSLGVN